MKRNIILTLLALGTISGIGLGVLFKQDTPPSSKISPPSSPPQVAVTPSIIDTPLLPAPVVVVPPAPIEPPATEAAETRETTQEPGTEIASLPPIIAPPLPPVRPRDPLEPEIKMSEFRMGSPVFIRIFKRENVLELWARHEGRYRLLKAYRICTWSGALGPKQQTGDYQAPEGFYSVTRKQLHPKSNYHRAFNLGYPNAYDRQLGRTGSALMVHGACASVGCYAMTDAGIAEIYPIVEAALKNEQKEIQVQVFPFRLSQATLKTMAKNPWYDFWKNLKEGYDRFEQTREPTQAYACKGRYVLSETEAKKDGCTRIAGW